MQPGYLTAPSTGAYFPSFLPPPRNTAVLQQLIASSPQPFPPPAWLPAAFRPLWLRVARLPIVSFYAYVWHRSPVLLATTLFVNFVLPILLEALPWYLSRRHLSKLLRDSKNSIQHRLISSTPLPVQVLSSFAFFSLLYSLLHTCEELLRTRLLLLNRLLIKRMLVERIVWSEPGELQQRCELLFGTGGMDGSSTSVADRGQGGLRTELLEAVVFNDINDTLTLFNSTLPSLLRSGYTLVLSSLDLYRARDRIDVLSILRPSILGLATESLNLLHSTYILDRQAWQLQRNALDSSRLLSNIVDGLAEIQVNNMQGYQLTRLDRLTADELQGKQGLLTFLSSCYRVVQGRGVVDFVSEVLVVQAVMARRGLTHEQYRKVQNDIDYVGRLVGRMYGLGREGWRVWDTQQRVMAVLHMPNFMHEDTERSGADGQAQGKPLLLLDEGEVRLEAAGEEEGSGAAAVATVEAETAAADVDVTFDELLVRRLWFRYDSHSPWALRIGEKATDSNRDGGLVDEEQEQKQNGRQSASRTASDANSEHISSEDYPDTSTGSTPGSSAHSASSAPLLRFRRGKTYAVIGQNRSGKSTLVQILCKLYTPSDAAHSQITLNGTRPFLTLPRVPWRRVLSYVPQRPFIFPGSIDDNVRMGNTAASADEVEAAGRRAGLFLFDDERQRAAERDRAAAEAGREEWVKGEAVRKPWEVSRVGDSLGWAWGWARRMWAWRSAVEEKRAELSGEEIEVEDGGVSMEDEAMGDRRRSVAGMSRLARQLSPPPMPPQSSSPLLALLDNRSPQTLALPPPISTASLSSLVLPPLASTLPQPHSAPSAPSSSATTAASTASSILQMATAEGGTNLSGGFAQSVALARVFLRPHSQLVILDEAMGAMDPIKKRECIVPALMRWVAERGCCLVLVTHDVRLMCPLVDAVYVMEEGRVVEAGSHRELVERQAPVYMRMLGDSA